MLHNLFYWLKTGQAMPSSQEIKQLIAQFEESYLAIRKIRLNELFEKDEGGMTELQIVVAQRAAAKDLLPLKAKLETIAKWSRDSKIRRLIIRYVIIDGCIEIYL